MISGTIIDQSGRTLSGQTVEAFWHSVSHARPLAVGLNCALGARALRAHLQELSRVAPVRISVHPNAGLPNAFGGYDETPAELAAVVGEFAQHGLVNIVGGCCGTTPDHIRAIAEAVRGVPPRRPPAQEPRLRLSGLEPLVVGPDDQLREHRRAHQRDRLAPLRQADPGRPVRGGARGGPAAGGERRPAHRRQHGRGDARRRGGDDPLPPPGGGGAGHRQGAGDDRLLASGRCSRRGSSACRARASSTASRSRRARSPSSGRRAWCGATAPRWW